MDEEVALKIIDFVSRTRARRDEQPLALEELRGRTVDPALLSVVCSELNNRRRARHEEKISFTLLSENKEEIIREFFDTHVNGLGPGAGATRRFIEEELITEGEGYRKRCALEEEMLRQQNVRKEDLRKLEQQRILRFEPSEGITWIELTHDLLTGVVRESRRERRAREEKEEADKKARTERERIEGEQRERRKRARTIAALGVAAVLVAGAIVVAIGFKRNAKRFETIATRADEEKTRANEEAKRANKEAKAADWYRVRFVTEKIQTELSETPPNVARARLMADDAAEMRMATPISRRPRCLESCRSSHRAAAVDHESKNTAQAAFSSDGNFFGILDEQGNFWVRRAWPIYRWTTTRTGRRSPDFVFILMESQSWPFDKRTRKAWSSMTTKRSKRSAGSSSRE